MRFIISIIFLSMVMALNSCSKKELPEPVEEEPVVWLEATLNNIPVVLKAGENAVYATTITHAIDSNFKEFIFKIDAPGLQKGIQITFIDSFKVFNSIMDELDNSIKTGDYKFAYSATYPFKLSANEMIVIYNDYDKKETYYSLHSQQGSTANFRIASVKDVIFNGKPFRMAEIYFSCKIKCPSNGWVYTITDGHGFIPFGQR